MSFPSGCTAWQPVNFSHYSGDSRNGAIHLKQARENDEVFCTKYGARSFAQKNAKEKRKRNQLIRRRSSTIAGGT
jgi:hypothetical protein